MPLRIRDRVKQRTLTIGTGVITFSSSLSSFQDFSGVLSDGDLTYYTIQNTSQFEVGQATYSGNTLDRGQVFVSSSGSSRIYLNQEADVFITYPASKAVFLETENNITGVDAFDFNTGVSPSYKQGRIFYDTDNGALAVYNDEADITLQVGQEEYLRAKNDGTGVILNGEAVRVLGSQGSNATIIKAIATGSLQSQSIGLATHDIEANSFGYVTTYGLVRGLDTSDLVEGSEIYLSNEIAGGLTGVSPVAPSYKTSIGHVVRSHPSVGSILVTPRAEKLGGPDVKSTNGNNIGASGVTFVELLTDEGAAILASNTGMVYDSGNQILEINAGGIKYPDGQTQTIAYTGQTADLSSYATTSYVNSVSGNLQTEITSNSSDITALQTATGLLDTDVQALQTATGLLDTDVQELQTATGLLEVRVTQNETDITALDTATGLLETRVTQNETDITALETATGLLDTRVTQNDNDIDSVSGLLYNYWVLRGDGATTTNVDSTEQVQFKGAGSVSVSLGGTDNREVTISGIAPSGGGMTNWNLSVTGDSTAITQAETVTFSGQGNVIASRSGNFVIITGVDQDLSSYATTSFVNSVSGNLQSQITSNDNDISTLQTNTGLLDIRVSQNESDIISLQNTDISLDSRISQNETDIAIVSGSLYNNWNINVSGNVDSIESNQTVVFTGLGLTTVSYDNVTNTVSISGTDQDLSSYATTAYVNSVSGNLQGEIDSNDTDIANLQTATGNLDTRVTQNTSDITSVSGLLYNNWKINVTGNIDDITSEQTVIFTGINGTDVTYNSSTNTVSISGGGGGGMTSWNVGVTGASDAITDGQTVTFTGLGATSVTYNDSTNTVSISGAVGSYSWNVGVTGTSDAINNGNTVTFTGAGQSNVTYNPSTNTVLISGVNSAPTGNHSGIAHFGSNNLITENTDFTISDSGKVYSKVSFGSLDDQGNKSGTITFNAESSNLHLTTLTGNSTLAITGEDIGQKILIRLQQDSVGGYIVNWWDNIKWAEGGTPPTLTTTSGKADMFGFIVTSGNGPYFYDGFIIGQNI